MSRRSALLAAAALLACSGCTTHYLVHTDDLVQARADVRANPDASVFIPAAEVKLEQDSRWSEVRRIPTGATVNLDVRDVQGGEGDEGPLSAVSFTSDAKPALLASGIVLVASGLALTIFGAAILAEPSCKQRQRWDDGGNMTGYCFDMRDGGVAMLLSGLAGVIGGSAMVLSGALIAPATSPVPHHGRQRSAGFGARLQGRF